MIIQAGEGQAGWKVSAKGEGMGWDEEKKRYELMSGKWREKVDEGQR